MECRHREQSCHPRRRRRHQSSIHGLRARFAPPELDPPPLELNSRRERGLCHLRLRPPFPPSFARPPAGWGERGMMAMERREAGGGEKRWQWRGETLVKGRSSASGGGKRWHHLSEGGGGGAATNGVAGGEGNRVREGGREGGEKGIGRN